MSEIGIGIKEGIFLAYTKMLQLEKLEKRKIKYVSASAAY